MIAALIAAARELGARPGNVYDYTPIVICSVYTGIRPSELLGLRWCDVDLTAGLIHVRHQLCRKTKTLVPTKSEAGVRDLPISDALVCFLRAYRLQSRFSQEEHFLFCSKNGSPLGQQNVNDRGIKPALAKAGLNRPGEPALSWYDLRHAFASLLAHHGFAAVDLAVFMGHADARVTQETYIHPYDEAATARRLRSLLEQAMLDQASALA
jgi:integrase